MFRSPSTDSSMTPDTSNQQPEIADEDTGDIVVLSRQPSTSSVVGSVSSSPPNIFIALPSDEGSVASNTQSSSPRSPSLSELRLPTNFQPYSPQSTATGSSRGWEVFYSDSRQSSPNQVSYAGLRARKKPGAFVVINPFHLTSSTDTDTIPAGKTVDDIDIDPPTASYELWDLNSYVTVHHSIVAAGSSYPYFQQQSTIFPFAPETSTIVPAVASPKFAAPGFASGPQYQQTPAITHSLWPNPENLPYITNLPSQKLSMWNRLIACLPWRKRKTAPTSDHHNSTQPSVKEGLRFAASTVYWCILLRLPAFYFGRVAQIFEESTLTLRELKRMALEVPLEIPIPLETPLETILATPLATLSETPGPFKSDLKENRGLNKTAEKTAEYRKLKHTWNAFIDSTMREWKTFNIISVLLLSAILTILQIDAAAADPLTRYTALFSLVCALISLLFGCMYIIRFGTMRRTYKAVEWALETKRTETAVLWNVWVLLAMPVIWLTWSIILYTVCIMSFIWRTSSDATDRPQPLSPSGLLAVRIVLTTVLWLGLSYTALILRTFSHYGGDMDRRWKQRIEDWRRPKPIDAGQIPNRKVDPHVRFMLPTYTNQAPYNIYATPPTLRTRIHPPATTVMPILHTYLYGSVPRGDVIFDLAGPFQPMRLVDNNLVRLLTADELNRDATHPPVYAMTIFCDIPIPDWPLRLYSGASDSYDPSFTPVKLGNVLSNIHSALQRQIPKKYWASLDSHQIDLVTQAYTKRCNKSGLEELALKTQGVKQLDFLLGKTKFRGLIPTGVSSESWKMVVSE